MRFAYFSVKETLMKTLMAIASALLLHLATGNAQISSNSVEYGDEDLCNTGTYSSDPKAGATLIGLAPNVVTLATHSFGHSFPFAPTPTDYPGTDQIYVGQVQTANRDGYSSYGGRLHGPQTITLDYSGLVPAGQNILTLTLGIGADDFQFPAWGDPFTVMINGATNTALAAAINGLNQTGPYEQFLSIGIDPAALQNNHILTLNISEGGDGGDGWALIFLTIGVTTSSNAPPNLGSLGAALSANGTGGNAIVISVPPNTTGGVLETATQLTPPVVWTPVWTNPGQPSISLPLTNFLNSKVQFFRLRQ